MGIQNVSSGPAAVISTASGTNINEKFEWNVSDCGDVIGDGMDEVIVGTPGYNMMAGPKIQSTLVELETKFIDVLEDWDGEVGSLEGVDVYLEGLMKS